MLQYKKIKIKNRMAGVQKKRREPLIESYCIWIVQHSFPSILVKVSSLHSKNWQRKMRSREKCRELHRIGEEYETSKGKRVCAKAQPDSTVIFIAL